MKRPAAAVLAAAAAVTAAAGLAVSAAAESAVRAEVAVSAPGEALDVRRIRVLDGLRAGESYRLPALGLRNRRTVRTAFRLVLLAGATHAGRRPPRHWLRFVPATAAVGAGRSRAIGVRLEIPEDAEPGLYAARLGVRPGDSAGARLTFRVEPAAGTRASVRHATSPAVWVVASLVGAAIAIVRLRGRARVST